MGEIRVSLSEARQDLSSYVDKAQAGELVVITKYGKPAAFIVNEEYLAGILETISLLRIPESTSVDVPGLDKLKLVSSNDLLRELERRLREL